VEAGSLGQLVPDPLRFMSSVVVRDQVNVQFFRHLLLDVVEKVAEFRRAVAMLPDRLYDGRTQEGE